MLQATVLVLGVIGPFLFPAYIQQIALLWIMVLFALTWDAMGGQMGYNSLGNIFFFGAGMYICAVAQIMVAGYDVGEYTSAYGAMKVDISDGAYFSGLFIGIAAAAVGSVILLAVILGRIFFGLRGPYFAIGTLGLALAAAELIGAWTGSAAAAGFRCRSIRRNWICSRAAATTRRCSSISSALISAVATYIFYKWLYSTRFGLAVNAIRDDEEKAEGMGIHTLRYKTVAWASSAFFLGSRARCTATSFTSSSRWRSPSRPSPSASSWWRWRCWAARARSGARFWARCCSIPSRRSPGRICSAGSGLRWA